jgi:uncharacterized protein with GYD domain
MAHYLHLVSYTSTAWAAQIQNPQNRVEVVKSLIEGQGGKVESAYMAFGEHDIVLLTEFPDNVSAATVAITAAAGGAISHIQTIPLLTIEEGMEALKRAGGAEYTPPGG